MEFIVNFGLPFDKAVEKVLEVARKYAGENRNR